MLSVIAIIFTKNSQHTNYTAQSSYKRVQLYYSNCPMPNRYQKQAMNRPKQLARAANIENLNQLLRMFTCTLRK